MIPVMWKADRTILNSRFDLPPEWTIETFPPQDIAPKPRIATKSRMEILNGELVLVFDNNTVVIHHRAKQRYDDQRIINYLMYKTFLCYNCLMPFRMNGEVPLPEEADHVAFKLHRYVTKSLEEDGSLIRFLDTEPAEVILKAEDVESYLTVSDRAAEYAICYYLLGCNTQRYFLFEFYKCLEVIRTHLCDEKKMEQALAPYGFLKNAYRDAKRLANDRGRPLSIARHAPFEGVSVKDIDTRWLFDDPVGRKAFEVGEKACRSAIDAYIGFRKANCPDYAS